MGDLTISLSTASDASDIDAYLESHPAALFNYSRPYRELVASFLRTDSGCLIARDLTGIRGIFPYAIASTPRGKVVNAFPYYGSHGAPLVSDPMAEKALWEKFAGLVHHDELVSQVVITNPLDRDGVLPASLQSLTGERVDDRLGQWTPLAGSSSEDELMSRFHVKTRNAVRKGLKGEFRIFQDHARLDQLHAIHDQNMQAIGGKAKPWEFFRKVPEHFVAGKTYQLWVAEKAGVTAAACLLFRFKDHLEYFTPVVREEFREEQALSALIFQAMLVGVSDGIRHWNWGGTWRSQEGVYRFKSRWGAVDRPYGYHIRQGPGLRGLGLAEAQSAYPGFYVAPYSTLK